MFKNKNLLAAISVIMIILFSGCTKGADQKEQVVLFAASSLSDVIMEFKEDYEKNNPNTELVINLAGSKTLRSQLENGAECDIFISANIKHYKKLEESEIARDGRGFLKNKMVLVVPKNNPANIQSMEDLSKENKLVLAQENVPAGDYARGVIENYCSLYGESYKQEVMDNVVSNESNVRQVLSKVVLGEADAALVYKTDVTENVSDSVNVIEIEDEFNIMGTYAICYINNDENERCCKASVEKCCDALRAEENNCLFEKYGFQCVDEVI